MVKYCRFGQKNPLNTKVDTSGEINPERFLESNSYHAKGDYVFSFFNAGANVFAEN